MRICRLLIALFVLPGFSFADGVLISWSPNQIDGLTQERFEAARTRSIDEVLELNRSLRSWPEVYEVAIGAQANLEDPTMLARLVGQLTDLTETKLELTSRLIVWERISSGEIFFDGRGLQVDDDLFLMSGRANWCLRLLTKRNFGSVKATTTSEQAEAIKAMWLKHLAGEEVEDVPAAFPSEEKGMTELRSPQAVHALISCLAESERKTAYTKERLQTLYGLTELPNEPGNPARMCNPDEYTHMYLAAITDVSDRHDHKWWTDWWTKNSDSLKWNSETAKFEVQTPPAAEAK